ncbi:MAG: hypothetical protein AB1689_28920 [Thermodesulfobacteriota bacterium]
MSKADAIFALGTALLVFAAHAASPVVTSFDSRWTIATAASIAHRGDTDLDEYEHLLHVDSYYGVERRGGHLYSRYPIGPALVALPAVVVLDGLARVLHVPSSEDVIQRRAWGRVEVAVASVIVAATSALVFLIARASGLRVAPALLVALVFGFCTPAWSTASRALWQHGPSMLMLAAALYLLLLARERPAWAVAAALPLAFALVVRPTNAVPLAAFTAYVGWRHPCQAIGYLALAAAVLAPFVCFNLALYGEPFSPYYHPSGQPVASGWSAAAVAALGHLVSPNRGLLVFSPVLVAAAAGAVAELRRRRFDALDLAVAASIVGHLVLISLAGQWWAGHSFGPRFFTDVLPLLTYFLGFAVAALDEMSCAARLRLALLFAALCAWSFYAHYRAATDWDVWAWNAEPVDVDERPERVWDWTDLQILRGAR